MTHIPARVAAVGVAVLLLAVSYSVADGLFSEEAGGCDGVVGVEGGGGFDFWFSGEVVLPSGVEGVAPRVRSVGVHAVSNSAERHRSLWSGDFELELRDDSGGVVGGVFFRLDPLGLYSEHVGTYEYVVASEVDLGVQDVRRFGVWVFDAPVFESYAVLWQGKELAVVNKAVHAPDVELSGVSDGQLVGGDEKIELCLAASDGAGDDLAYRVYYSTDGGTSYGLHQQLTDAASSGTDISGFVLDASDVAGSDTARVGVSVSDGTRSAFVETPVFVVEQHAPVVSIELHRANMVLDRGWGTGINVLVHDAEDGYLTVDDVSLHSSVDGPLRVLAGSLAGLGVASFFAGDTLSFGRHVITATATDSSGRSTTAVATIDAISGYGPPSVAGDVAHVPLFATALIDVLKNDFVIISDDFALTTPPTLGEAGSRLGDYREFDLQHNGIYLRYTGTSSGVDSLEYQICNRSSTPVCDTATVEIYVGIGDCTILGTEDDDHLVGTSGDDIICGLGGNDTIDGASGDDIIRGGTGDDILTGGVGDDYIRGEPGNDIINGDAGRDILFGGTGGDVIYGGEGYDILSGADKISEQQPTDELYYGNTQTPISFDEFTDTEAETINTAIVECQQAISEPYFESRDTRSQCTNILTNLCRSGTFQNNSRLEVDRARNTTVDFICSAAQLAKLGEQSYLTLDSETDLTVTDQRARSDTFRFIESQILKLYNILVENANGISETTTAKLRELTQTINRFATKAFERPPPIYE